MQRQEDQEEEEVLSSKKDMLPNGVSYIDLCTAEQSTLLCDAYYVFWGAKYFLALGVSLSHPQSSVMKASPFLFSRTGALSRVGK